MLDRIYLTNERLIQNENEKVKKPNSIAEIGKESRERKNGESFKYKLNKIRKKKAIDKEKSENIEELEEGVVVSKSLSSLLDENKIIGELVKEKFVDNPKVNHTINFSDEELIE